MKTLIFILLLIFLVNTVACKQQAKESNFLEQPDVTSPDIPADVNLIGSDQIFVSGAFREPSQVEIDYDYYPDEIEPNDQPEASGRFRRPNYYECRMLANWTIGIQKTWYFANDQFDYEVRFDKDGIEKYNKSVAYEELIIGSCRMGVNRNTAEILYLAWMFAGYEEIILDIR